MTSNGEGNWCDLNGSCNSIVDPIALGMPVTPQYISDVLNQTSDDQLSTILNISLSGANQCTSEDHDATIFNVRKRAFVEQPPGDNCGSRILICAQYPGQPLGRPRA